MRSLPLLLLLAACSGTAAQEVRYAGPMMPEEKCSEPGHATLVVTGTQASFVANDGAVILPARVDPDGRLSGQLVIAGGDKKPFPLRLEGLVTADTASGTYATPRCRFALSLTRVRLGLFGGAD